MKGYCTADAIALGLSKTGGIITAAGMIMAVAFGGLMFSRVGTMNQYSFFLFWGVLFDTFVVRSLLVPTMMSLFPGDSTWWPGKVPAVIKPRRTRTFKKLK